MSVGDTDFKCGIVGCNLLMSVSAMIFVQYVGESYYMKL